ncbi:MAG: hypothetical protein K2Q10_04710 [Rhodospirillales bacterium]|nr:hypothetical protein [Rhodospirillales bacterium]
MPHTATELRVLEEEIERLQKELMQPGIAEAMKDHARQKLDEITQEIHRRKARAWAGQ